MEDPVFFNLVIKMHEKHRTCQVGVYNDFSRYLNWNLKLLFFSSYEEISHRYFSKIFSSIKILIKMKIIFEKKAPQNSSNPTTKQARNNYQIAY